MSEPDPQTYLSDPLSPLARAERRNLLIASTIGLLVHYAGLVPTQISALGVEISPPEQSAVGFVIAAAICYFLAAFIIYATVDFFIWKKRYNDYQKSVEIMAQTWTEEDQRAHDEVHEHVPALTWYYQLSPVVAYARMIFEFPLPMLLAAFTAYKLFWS
jgi:hypothetical protein